MIQFGRREDGVAILTVILAVLLLTILSAALLLVARVSLGRSVVTTDSTRALDAAESGLYTAPAAVMRLADWAQNSGTLPLGDLAGDGQYEVTWKAETALPWFTLVSTGYYPDKLTAVGKRRIKAEVFSLNPWDFMYAGGMSGATVNGNVQVHGPFYVNDNLLLSGTAGVFGGPLILYDTSAPGDADLILDSNSADIGRSGANVGLFIDGTVKQLRNPSSYYASPVYNWAPKLEFPLIEDLDYYRADNPNSPWLGDTDRPTTVWDKVGDSVTDNSTSLTFSKAGAPVPTDPRLRGVGVTWTQSGNDLTIVFDNTGGIRPILFVDGDLNIVGGPGGLTIRYQGVGTIVASGSISVNGNLVPVGSTMPLDGSMATLADFPTASSGGLGNCLGLVTPRNVNFEGTSSQWFAAAVYAAGTASFSKQGNLYGAAVTSKLDLGSQVPTLWGAPTFSLKLPPRMPGADARITSIIGWSELTP